MPFSPFVGGPKAGSAGASGAYMWWDSVMQCHWAALLLVLLLAYDQAADHRDIGGAGELGDRRLGLLLFLQIFIGLFGMNIVIGI